MTFHNRSEWSRRASTCTARFVSSEVEGVAVHWNGPAVTLSPAAQLRADEAYHMDAKGGCAIFYNLCVDQTGDVWEARGIELRGGANGDSSSNRRFVSICGLIGVGQAPTSAMYAAFRDAISLIRQRYPQALAIKTHNDVRPEPTACPGPDLTAAVRNGTLEPQDEELDLTPDEAQKLNDVWSWLQQLTEELHWPAHPTFRASLVNAVAEALNTNQKIELVRALLVQLTEEEGWPAHPQFRSSLIEAVREAVAPT